MSHASAAGELPRCRRIVYRIRTQNRVEVSGGDVAEERRGIEKFGRREDSLRPCWTTNEFEYRNL